MYRNSRDELNNESTIPILHYTTLHYMRSNYYCTCVQQHVMANKLCMKYTWNYNAVIVKAVRFMDVHCLHICCFLHMDCHFIVGTVLLGSRRHWRILLFHCPVSSVVSYVIAGTCITWLSHDIHAHVCMCHMTVTWHTYTCMYVCVCMYVSETWIGVVCLCCHFSHSSVWCGVGGGNCVWSDKATVALCLSL